MKKIVGAGLGFFLLTASAFAQFAPTPGASSATPTYIAPVGGLLPTNGIQTCGPTTFVLSALSAIASLPCPGAAGYIVKVEPVTGQSAFIGSLQASGDGNSWRSRRFFRTGVGELDTSTEVLDGTQGSLEYRLSAGDSAAVVVSKYTSGQVQVTISGSLNTGMVFLNGPIHTSEEAAVRAGRGFGLATQLTAVTANQFYNFALINPAGTGRNIFVQTIQVCQTSGTVLQLSQRLSVGAQTSAITPSAVVPFNRRPDSMMASVLTAAAGASTTAITAGTLSLQIPLKPSGECTVIPAVDMLTPGQSIGMTVAGVGGGLAGAASSISVFVDDYEEGVN